MSNSDLAFNDAHCLRSMLDKGDISASELLAACISNYDTHNEALNAVVTSNVDQAILQAAAFDKSSANSGLLAGLPIAVKDVFSTAGIRTTYGNLNFEHNVPDADDILVEREKAAGAIILGKSNTPDCAAGGITENAIFGRTLNPWDITKTTSGSGGGGVSALAAGMVALADGSDLGGSVRSPAAWTNIVGFRPSSGRIPGLPGGMADGAISTAGVFARCVTDVALFTEAVEGPDPRSAISYPRGEAICHKQLEQQQDNLTIAWMDSFADAKIDDEISAQFNDHAAVLGSHNNVMLSHQFDPGENYRTLFADFNAYAYVKGLPENVLNACLRGEEVMPRIATNVERYSALSDIGVHEMFKARDVLKAKLQTFMAVCPILAQPMHAELAFAAGDYAAEETYDCAAMYLAPMLGLPSICVPLGFTRDGMPHGIMFTARAGQDQTLLQVARAFERGTGYGKKRSGLIG